MRLLALTMVGIALAVPQAFGQAPAPLPRPMPQPGPRAGLPVGKWKVEYANEVTEVCDVQQNGTAAVVEPVRIAGGKAVVSGGSAVMVFENGRVQRWTPVGKRFAVEHWFPGSRFPTAAADVLGIAERAR